MFQFLRTGKTKQCTLGQLLRKEFNKEAFGGVLGLWGWLLKWSLYKLFLFFINILTNEHLSNKCNAEPAGSKSVPVLQLEKIRLSNKPKTLFFYPEYNSCWKAQFSLLEPPWVSGSSRLQKSKFKREFSLLGVGGSKRLPGWFGTLCPSSKFNVFCFVFLGGGVPVYRRTCSNRLKSKWTKVPVWARGGAG